MSQIKFESTVSELVSENYPYGYKLRTTKTDWLEFNPRKGFRHVSQTINPKTGRPNAPKRGTYNQIQLLGRDENGHVKGWATDLNGADEWKRCLPFISEHFHLFTIEQIKHIYLTWIFMSKVHLKAMAIYAGADVDKMLPLMEKAVKTAVRGVNSCTGGAHIENLFSEINSSIDYEALENTKTPGYNPFKVTSYGI